MGSFKLAIVVLGWVAMGAHAGASKSSAPCEEYPWFDNTWTVITSNEPIIQIEFNNLATAAGIAPGRVPMTNCRVEFPVDENNRQIDGERSILTDKLWYDGSVKRHMGLLVLFNEFREVENGATYIRKRVTGYTICRTPAACEKLRIPF